MSMPDRNLLSCRRFPLMNAGNFHDHQLDFRHLLSLGLHVAEPASAYSTKKEIVLFDGKSLAGWIITDFGGQGEVTVEEGGILLDIGGDMTGITLEKAEKIPRTNYEITLQAKRVRGGDFSAG